MSVLVTGFGTFGGEALNPSGEVAERLDGTEIAGVSVTGVTLPVAHGRVSGVLATAVDQRRPQLVLVLGVAPGRNALALERIAVNVCDFPIPDIDGAQPVDVPVVAGGPDGYLSSLPIKKILHTWQHNQIPGYVSNTAGTYLCNQVFYLAVHHARQRRMAAGLIHLPSTPQSASRSREQTPVPVPTMDLHLQEFAVRLAIETSLQHDGADLALAAGALC